jgi:NADPH2:quinone reductase
MEPADVTLSEIEAPKPSAGELLIEVHAAALNFSDILLLQGKYQVKPKHPFILGREAAGVVVEVGESVTDFAKGDRVLAPTDLGAFAERVAVSAAVAHHMPDGMSFAEGAAIPIVYPTSHAALVDRAALREGETLLVHAAAGGVGLAAVQIGAALGARVIATAGGAEKLEIAREAGASVTIDYRTEDFAERVLAETNGAGADVIYDPVGGDTFDRSLGCIAWKGRLIVVGFASGRIPEVAANRIMLKNISVLGIHWPAYAEREPEVVDAIFEELSRMYERGAIRPLIGARRPLEEAGAALVDLATRRTVGKVVLEPRIQPLD